MWASGMILLAANASHDLIVSVRQATDLASSQCTISLTWNDCMHEGHRSRLSSDTRSFWPIDALFVDLFYLLI